MDAAMAIAVRTLGDDAAPTEARRIAADALSELRDITTAPLAARVAERSLDEELVAKSIGDASPERTADRGHGWRDPHRESAPHRDIAAAADAELLDVKREEGHHQREAGEADEGGHGDRELIAPPMQMGSGGHFQGNDTGCDFRQRRQKITPAVISSPMTSDPFKT